MSIPGTPNDISTPRPGDHIGPMSFRKKPVEIEAMRWSGHNLRQVIDFTGLHPSANKWTWEEYEAVVAKDGLKIFTLEGPLMAAVGDWIIKGVKGEFYPCKPDIFAATYQSSHVVHPGGVCISCRDEIEAASPPSADERIAELEREVFAKEQEALLARAGWIVRENEIERLKGELADTKRRLADAFRALDNAASSPSAGPASSERDDLERLIESGRQFRLRMARSPDEAMNIALSANDLARIGFALRQLSVQSAELATYRRALDAIIADPDADAVQIAHEAITPFTEWRAATPEESAAIDAAVGISRPSQSATVAISTKEKS